MDRLWAYLIVSMDSVRNVMYTWVQARTVTSYYGILRYATSQTNKAQPHIPAQSIHAQATRRNIETADAEVAVVLVVQRHEQHLRTEKRPRFKKMITVKPKVRELYKRYQVCVCL